MKIHIIMPVLNCLALTRGAVDSFVAEEKFTIHIVDQASNDGTKEWAEEKINGQFLYHRYDPRVSLSEAWNRGIQESLTDEECQYMLIVNNDVIFHKTTINSLVYMIDELKHDLVTGQNVQPTMSLAEMNSKDEWGDFDHDARPVTSWIDEGPDFSCFMIKRGFVEKFGWFDESFFPAYCEDQCCHIRVRRGGGTAKRLTTAPYYHIASQTIAKNPGLIGWVSEGHHRNKLYYRKKWGTTHGEALKGNGFKTPFNDPNKTIKWWDGCEKYEA